MLNFGGDEKENRKVVAGN